MKRKHYRKGLRQIKGGNMIELKNITKIYKDKSIGLSNFSYNFHDTGLYFLVGKSGSGKSTLLNLLSTVLTPTNGSVIYNNKRLKKRDYHIFRKYEIGLVFQDFNLLNDKTVYENLSLVLGIFKDVDEKEIILSTLKKVSLDGYENKKITELSGGEIQRVAIARVLIKNPKVLLLDEPTSNLDSKNSELIFEILKNLSKDHLVIVSSHNQDIVSKYADVILELKNGRLENEIVIKKPILNSLKEINYQKSNKLFFKILKENIFSNYIRKIIFISIITISLFMFLSVLIFNKYDTTKNVINTNQKYHNDELEITSFYEYQELDSNGKIRIVSKNRIYQYKYYKENEDILIKGVNYIGYDFDYGRHGGVFNENRKNTLLISREYKVPNLMYGRQIQNNFEIIITDFVADYILYYHYQNQNLEIKDLIDQEINMIGYLGYTTGYIPIFNEDLKIPFKIVGIKRTVYSDMFLGLKENFPDENPMIADDIANMCSRTYILEEDYNNLEIQKYHAYFEYNDKTHYLSIFTNECLFKNINIGYRVKDLESNDVILPKRVIDEIFNLDINSENYIELLKDKKINLVYRVDESNYQSIELSVIGFNNSNNTFCVSNDILGLIKQSEEMKMYLPIDKDTLNNLKTLTSNQIRYINYMDQIIKASNEFVNGLKIIIIPLIIISLVIGLIIGYQTCTLTLKENSRKIGIYFNFGLSKLELIIINLIEILILIIFINFISYLFVILFGYFMNNTYFGFIFDGYSLDGIANYTTYIYQYQFTDILYGIPYLAIVFLITQLLPMFFVYKKDLYLLIKEK